MFQTRHWTGRTAKVSGRLDGFGAFVPNLDGTDTPTPYRLTPASRQGYRIWPISRNRMANRTESHREQTLRCSMPVP
ncbi:hypothetical protein CN204_22445, partial [Sinorhizobium meliloti]